MKNSSQKGSTVSLLIVLAIVVIVGGIYYVSTKRSVPPVGSVEDLGSVQEASSTEIIGGDRDAHGCLGPAGYLWSEKSQKCVRPWEENASSTNNVVSCSKEAKMCPDGSTVGRVAPSCEFKACKTATTTIDTSGWKTYTSTKNGFTFKYPALLTAGPDGDVITLSHSIAYKHPNPCDFKGDAGLSERLSDFGVYIKVVNTNLKEYVQSSVYPGWDYVSKNPFQAGSLSGYKIEEGVEGCGAYVYYFSISPTKTLVVDRSIVTEFTPNVGDYQKYLGLPGIISPSTADEIFTRIVSTLKLTVVATSKAKEFIDSMQKILGTNYLVVNTSNEIGFPGSGSGPSIRKTLNGYSFTFVDRSATAYNNYMRNAIGPTPAWLASEREMGYINGTIICLQRDGTVADAYRQQRPAEIFCADLDQ